MLEHHSAPPHKVLISYCALGLEARAFIAVHPTLFYERCPLELYFAVQKTWRFCSTETVSNTLPRVPQLSTNALVVYFREEIVSLSGMCDYRSITMQLIHN